MRLGLIALVCGLSLATGLTGCASLTGKAVLTSAAKFQERLYSMKSWKLEGRMAAVAGREGWHANLVWEHEGAQERLRIFGPFNQGAISIIVQSDLIYINEGNGITTVSRNPDEMLKSRLGFAVPLYSLRYWVLGLPAPNVEYQPVLDASGGLKGFEQQGWLMALESFDTIGNYVLPHKMSIRGNEVLLKLIADEWVLNE